MNRRYIKIRRLTLLMLLAAILCTLLPAATFADETKNELTLSTSLEQDLHVNLYRIADWSVSSEKIVLTGQFGDYKVRISMASAGKLQAAAQSLADFVKRDRPLASMTQTLRAGENLAINDLADGVYLMTVDTVRTEDTVYEFTPMILFLPNRDENGEGIYEQEIRVSKYQAFERRPKNIRVAKVWKDMGDADDVDRPIELTVYLLKDGDVEDSQTLNGSNGWNYTWSELSPDFDWSVVEEDLTEDYKVSTEKTADGLVITYILTNISPDAEWQEDNPNNPGRPKTPTPTAPPTETPTPTDGPDSEIPDNPHNPNKPKTPTPTPTNPSKTPTKKVTPTPTASKTTRTTKSGRLPQTGLLWWPVPILVLIGVIFLSVGYIRKDKNKRK